MSKEKELKRTTRCRCFAVLGVDILVDSKLKPWLLEINHLPSFATESDLDYSIKSRLISQTLDLIPIVPMAQGKKLFGTEDFDGLWADRKRQGDERLNEFEKIYPIAEQFDPSAESPVRPCCPSTLLGGASPAPVVFSSPAKSSSRIIHTTDEVE
ncbi:unnamed protein product [Amoebophrya sp. A25]|nr:unnamed protein product [Amoebophrya sp. A25]|eukprot:GSA25T00016042001.1